MSVHLVIPLEPPSVNHYAKVTYKGGKKRHYLTPEATAFKQAVYMLSRHCDPLHADEYDVTVAVYQGKGSRGDLDNYAKVTLDGLVDARVIHSDSAVVKLTMMKARDWANPRTEIWVEAK